MKKLFLFSSLVMILALAACGGNEESGYSNGGGSSDQTDNGNQTASGEESSKDTGTLQVLKNDEVGKYLADGSGMTLYYFKKDEAGESYCKDGCLEKWPIFYAKNLKAPDGYNESNFGTLTRENGKKQTTYKGHPLYYYTPDKEKGDVKGQGVGNVWFVVNKQLNPLKMEESEEQESNSSY